MGNKRKKDDPEQSKRFEEAARETGASDASDAFERAIESLKPKKTSHHKSN